MLLGRIRAAAAIPAAPIAKHTARLASSRRTRRRGSIAGCGSFRYHHRNAGIQIAMKSSETSAGVEEPEIK